MARSTYLAEVVIVKPAPVLAHIELQNCRMDSAAGCDAGWRESVDPLTTRNITIEPRTGLKVRSCHKRRLLLGLQCELCACGAGTVQAL